MQTVDILTTDYETLERTLNDALSSHGSRWEIFFEQIQSSALATDDNRWNTDISAAIERIAMLRDNIEYNGQPAQEIKQLFGELIADLDARLSQHKYLRSRELRRTGQGPELGDGLWDGVLGASNADTRSC